MTLVHVSVLKAYFTIRFTVGREALLCTYVLSADRAAVTSVYCALSNRRGARVAGRGRVMTDQCPVHRMQITGKSLNMGLWRNIARQVRHDAHCLQSQFEIVSPQPPSGLPDSTTQCCSSTHNSRWIKCLRHGRNSCTPRCSCPQRRAAVD